MYNYYSDEYGSFIIYSLVAFLFTLFLWLVAVTLKTNRTLHENGSQYECGFEPFGAKFSFDIQYFILGLLYLIFDVELVILIPWITHISLVSFVGTVVMFWFIIVLILGLVYEWKKSVLHWV